MSRGGFLHLCLVPLVSLIYFLSIFRRVESIKGDKGEKYFVNVWGGGDRRVALTSKVPGLSWRGYLVVLVTVLVPTFPTPGQY